MKPILRNFLRDKMYSSINLLGLTLGITCFIFLGALVIDELSYDRFHSDYDNIYRVVLNANINGNELNSALTGVPVREAIQNQVPEIIASARLAQWHEVPVQNNQLTATENRVLLADSNFFEIFGFKMLESRPDALKGPGKVVLSEAAAAKYFGYRPGGKSPIGEILLLGSHGKYICQVTGIVASPPSRSHIQFNMIVSLPTWELNEHPGWINTAVYTYCKTISGTSITLLESKIRQVADSYFKLEVSQFFNSSLHEFRRQGNTLELSLQPITDIHLLSELDDELEHNGNYQYLYLLGSVGALILLLGCVNFMNLATARATKVAKEIGVRKSIGATRYTLAKGFLLESIGHTAFAGLVSLFVVTATLPFFNEFSGKNLAISDFTSDPLLVTILMAIILLIGILAGSYPAFYLTRFKPATVLRGGLVPRASDSTVRNVLVVFQFFISIVLVSATLMINRQLKFLQAFDVGFEKENMIAISNTFELGHRASGLKSELLQSSAISGASFTNRLPPDMEGSTIFRLPNSDQNFMMSAFDVDYDNMKTMKYELVAGRFFSSEFISDENAVIINETAARQLGWHRDFADKKLLTRIDASPPQELHVIGIIRDFNFETLKSGVRPLAILLGTEPNAKLAIRLLPGNINEKITAIETIWKKYADGIPFEYSFIGQSFDSKLQTETRLGNIFLLFTILAIIIASLGLFGLSAFVIDQRSREISIRKVLGASVQSILILLLNSFSKLVLIAFIASVPLSIYLIERWLSGFAYRIAVDATVFVLSGVVGFVVACTTISFQSIKAAHINPVLWLRKE